MPHFKLNAVIIMALLFLLPHALADTPLAVTYIGTNNHPIVNADAADHDNVALSVYNVDDHRNLEKKLSVDLPQDLKEAERIANERLQALDGKLVQDAFKGVALTLMWDLKKVPAIVFGEGEQVIYGVTDMNEALKRYKYFISRTRR